jgi:glycosyltransferase involved in cell wall biosynthesis
MRPLNILHVLRAPLGGLFRHVVDLVSGQVARGHNVGVIVDTLTGNDRARETLGRLEPTLKLGISETPMPRPLSPRDLGAVLHVSKRVWQTKADVLHGHGAKGGAYARLAFAGRPVLRAYTPHGGSLLFDHKTIAGKAYLTLEKLLMARGDVYLFESAFSADVFNAKVGRPKGLVQVIHNGISKVEFAPVPLAEDATDIVFVGEYRTVKGIDTLIDALAMLGQEGRSLTATLVGSGPERENLQAHVARLGLTDSIRFAAARPMRQALALGKLVVLPSRAESLPYVVLEAAAAERPMITTRVGGIPEIYGPLSDSLVPPADPTALAQAIKADEDQPAAANERAQTLRARIAASFSVEAMVDGVLSCYERALEVAPFMGQVLGA